MKKLISIFAMMFVVLAISACGSVENQNTTPVLDQTVQKNTFTYQNFQFEIPKTWTIVSQEDQQVVLETATQPYQIRETVLFSVDEHFGPMEDSLFHTSTDGLKIYDNPCAPAMGCFAIEDNGAFMLMTWTMPSSSEIPPENLTEIWFPAVNFSTDDVLNIVKTIKRVE